MKQVVALEDGQAILKIEAFVKQVATPSSLPTLSAREIAALERGRADLDAGRSTEFETIEEAIEDIFGPENERTATTNEKAA